MGENDPKVVVIGGLRWRRRGGRLGEYGWLRSFHGGWDYLEMVGGLTAGGWVGRTDCWLGELALTSAAIAWLRGCFGGLHGRCGGSRWS